MTLNNYFVQQSNELQKLKEVKHHLQKKLKKQRHIGTSLNQQAIHFEVLLRKMRPDILKKKLDSRPDSRIVNDDGVDVVKQILTEQGLLKEG